MHKRIALKILKFTLKQLPTYFGAVTPSSGSALFVLAKAVGFHPFYRPRKPLGLVEV